MLVGALHRLRELHAPVRAHAELRRFPLETENGAADGWAADAREGEDAQAPQPLQRAGLAEPSLSL